MPSTLLNRGDDPQQTSTELVTRRRADYLIIVVAWVASASPTCAHGFGQRYDLPLPLWHYLWGAGATVAFSFVILAVFLKADWASRSSPTIRLSLRGSALALGNVARALASVLGILALLIVALAGSLGDQNPFKNIAPVMVWIIGWVGLAFMSAVLGDVWRFLNPWDAVFNAAEWVHRRLHGGTLSLRRPYPAWLGVWPALGLFVVFAWMELVWSGRSVPANLAAALAVYSALTWAGMLLFGRQTWLKRGEVFSLVFGIFARFAPMACAAAAKGQVDIRLPASGLIEDRPLHSSMVALVITLLATVTFDGVLETPLWAHVDAAILDAPSESALWTVFDLREDQALRLARSVGLAGIILLFVAGYLTVCRLMAALSADKTVTTVMLARRFVLTLVPISLAYHVAHYFSYLCVGGQYVIPLVSDPFGWGWNLFGTASYRVDVGLIGPRLQWNVAVVSIVLGHIIAVCLSHIVSLRIDPAPRSAIVTQIPMVILMVGYTMCSLWILSQPIIETGTG
jgi:hypothetical protein